MARLFFALWPDPPARAALAALAEEVAARTGGRAVAADRIHLTLAFLGEVAPAKAGAARAAAAGVAVDEFTLALNGIGAFPRAGVAWAGAEPLPEALAGLQSALAGRLARAGFRLERRAFAAHLTLARRIARPLGPEPIAPIPWCVTDFALVETVPPDGSYRTLERWTLGKG